MRFYAACLASYNNGILHGRWIEATSDIEEMGAEVAAMLAGSRVPGAEEWAIHDTEDLPASIGEFSGLQPIADFAELVEDFDHIEADTLRAIVEEFRDVDAAREALKDDFIGIYGDFREYADEYADEIILADCNCDAAQWYFDYAAFARDLAMDMRVFDVPSGVAVFHS